MARKLKAPELVGRGGWINTDGQSLSLAGLLGRVVLLDFWTSACINCLGVLEELRELEDEFGDALVVIGVHSPKFSHEGEHAAVVAAVGRNHIAHAVLDDPDMTTWSSYGVRAWPTLVLIDQAGDVVHAAAGEGHGPTFAAVIRQLLGRPAPNGVPAVEEPDPRPASAALYYPSKARVLADGTLLVADAGGDDLVHLSADAQTVLARIGTGRRGFTDGAADVAQFAEPSGLCLLPPDVAELMGVDVVVADRVNGAVRGVRLADYTVRTLADGIRGPWDVQWWEAAGLVIIAVAGSHTLASLDPSTGEVRNFAGTGYESINDGAAQRATFAQTCGLAAEPGPSGRLWIVDSETSALRSLQVTDRRVEVSTSVGTGLFDFGHRDGVGRAALLQHPQGVTVLADGSVAVADTFNGALRRFDPATGDVTTLAVGLAEPTDVVELGGQLLVVESAGSRISRPLIAATHVAAVTGAGTVSLALRRDSVVTVLPALPAGTHLDPSAPSELRVSALPGDALLEEGSGQTRALTASLTFAPGVKKATLRIGATIAFCEEGEHAVCRFARTSWEVRAEIDDARGQADFAFVLDAQES